MLLKSSHIATNPIRSLSPGSSLVYFDLGLGGEGWKPEVGRTQDSAKKRVDMKMININDKK